MRTAEYTRLVENVELAFAVALLPVALFPVALVLKMNAFAVADVFEIHSLQTFAVRKCETKTHKI